MLGTLLVTHHHVVGDGYEFYTLAVHRHWVSAWCWIMSKLKKVTKSTRLLFSLSTQVSFSWIASCMRILELNWSIFYVIQNSCVCNFYGTTLWKVKVIIPHGEIAHNPSSVWSYLLGKIGIPQHRSGSSGKVLFFIQNFCARRLPMQTIPAVSKAHCNVFK